MPFKDRSEGIGTRAEIQHVYFGFFTLLLSSTTMDHALWKVSIHVKIPSFSNYLVWLS
jgi:hypothetical protein